jgi:glucuronoarabinoxylan endo-1,4-beta-xylanase
MKSIYQNLILLLLAIGLPLSAQNLLENGDFENKFDLWENAIDETATGEFVLDSTDAYEGNYALKVTIAQLGENDWSIQSIHEGWPSQTEVEYRLRLYAKADEAGTTMRAIQQLEEYDATDFTLTTSWQEYEWIFSAQEDNQQLKFHWYAEGTIYLDDIRIEVYDVTYPEDNTLDVNTATRYQTIEGFGGAIAFYEGWVVAHPNRDLIFDLLYNDMGINLLRIRNKYRYETSFSSEETELVALAEEHSEEDVKVLLSSWSPPADLKDNGNVNNGTLRQENGAFVYQEFADYWRDALVAYSEIDVVPDWIGIQNEPDYQTDDWETCKFTPTETDEYPGYDVALDYVYNEISSLPNVPLILGAEELGIGYNNFTNFSEPIQDKSHLWAYGYHLYHGGDPALPDSYNSSFNNISQNFGDKPNIMTEYEAFDEGWFNTAWLVSNNLSYGNASAYFYWDLIWPDGGLISMDNPWDEANWSNENGFSVNPHFYAFKHFAKYIRRGYERVEATNTNEGIRSSVFISPDGTELVMVLINIAEHAVTTNAVPAGWQSTNSQIYQSVEGNMYQSLGSVPASGELSLPAQSVSTIVFGDGVVDNLPPQAEFAFDPPVDFAPVEVCFDASASSDPDEDLLTYSWDFGDGNTGSGVNPCHTYQSAGNYTVSLIVSDGELTDEALQAITITEEGGNNPPVASISVSTTDAEVNETISFDASASADPDGDALTYSWDFGDGNSSNGATATHMFTAEGVYQTTLTVSDGSLTDMASVDITVTGTPIDICDSPTQISLPFAQNGAGEFCFFTSGDVIYINSWNMDLVEVNGVDFTNVWAGSLPARVDGGYYIRYSASVSWAHFEIDGTDIVGPTPVVLTVNTVGGGSVSPAGGEYELNETVTLQATADEGYIFDGWSGDLSGDENPVSIAMDADKEITATFIDDVVPTYTLSTSVTGQGVVQLSPTGGVYEAGTMVTLTAVPDAGATFSEWEGDVIGSDNPVSITISGNVDVTAVFFTDVPEYTITTSVSEGGSIVLNPSEDTYPEGTEVTITAVPDENCTFSGWSGSISGTDNPVTVTVSSDLTLIAEFICDIPIPCDNPISISIPFVQNGAGEYCWVTTTEMAYINSWNLDELTVNGVDFSNTWASDLPSANTDGEWVIHYVGPYGWSHFEAPAAKSAESDISVTAIEIYPNPAQTEVVISSASEIKEITLISISGEEVLHQEVQSDNANLNVEAFQPGLYLVRVRTEKGMITERLIIK